MKYNTPLISVIILNYNGGQIVKRCIESVLRSKYPNFEVIVFDNASRDGSYEAIFKEFSGINNLKIIRSNVNYGFAKGNNIALNYAKGNFILFLNNDTEVNKYWINELLKVFMEGFNGIVQCKLIFMHDKTTLESLGAYIDRCGYGYEGLLIVNKIDVTHEIFYANGAAFIVPRDLVKNISLHDEFFDEDYFFSYEDCDISWRAKIFGYKTKICPTAIVFHQRGLATSSLRKSNILTLYHCKNRIMTLIKNYTLKNIIKYLPLLLILELSRAGLYFVKGKKSYSLAIIEAIFWNLQKFKTNYQKHILIQSRRKINDDYIINLMKKANIANLYYNFRFYERLSRKFGTLIR